MKIQPLRCSSSIIAPVKVLSLCVYMWMSMKILTMYYQYRVVVTMDTTDRAASYLDLNIEIDSEGRLRTKHYDKRDDFNFPIVNIPFICSNIPAAPVYGVYISQLIRYSRNDNSRYQHAHVCFVV
jgi:hypothetical protein